MGKGDRPRQIHLSRAEHVEAAPHFGFVVIEAFGLAFEGRLVDSSAVEIGVHEPVALLLQLPQAGREVRLGCVRCSDTLLPGVFQHGAEHGQRFGPEADIDELVDEQIFEVLLADVGTTAALPRAAVVGVAAGPPCGPTPGDGRRAPAATHHTADGEFGIVSDPYGLPGCSTLDDSLCGVESPGVHKWLEVALDIDVPLRIQSCS